MKRTNPIKLISTLWLIIGLFPWLAWAEAEMPAPETYLPSTAEIMKQKASFNDRTDLFKTFNPKDILPPEIWKHMNFDVEEMKKQTAEILGFASPEIVGKIAPEIKPGKYTYKDLDKHPGLKELFTPMVLKTVKAGGPPYVCSIMDFEIQPTRQLHWALSLCELTKKNLGKTQLDKDGYIVAGSWQGGVPFPRPSGKFTAQQVYYNFEKRSQSYDKCNRLTGEGLAFDKNLRVDKYNKYAQKKIRLMGRALIPPFGFFDKRAEKRGEFEITATEIYEPRANRGLVTMTLRYDDPYKMDPTLMYLPQMRRVRKMSSTDTQDPNGDSLYDDRGFLLQKITPKRYPYKFEIIDEREYLLAVSYNYATSWVDKENGYAVRDLGFMRRPCYVLQMTQLDPNYTYSKRIYYIDKESWAPTFAEFYDQKGRLYRTYNVSFGFIPEVGQMVPHGTPAWQVDQVDTHSSYQILVYLPANFSRNDVNMKNMIRSGK
ncbi:MAG: outer membrane lipoprotein-sorting protein [Deltaproteobacteria bacterium]|nr:outer membrane lipoprotein-sorting protein [Deltaproteobacteria bacterium]